MSHRQSLLAALAIVVLGADTALASVPPSFATKVAQGGMAEVQLSQMASEHAADPDVKTFAQRMVTDHSKANDELKQLAATKGWTLPAQTDAAHQTKATQLQALNGAAFD